MDSLLHACVTCLIFLLIDSLFHDLCLCVKVAYAHMTKYLDTRKACLISTSTRLGNRRVIVIKQLNYEHP